MLGHRSTPGIFLKKFAAVKSSTHPLGPLVVSFLLLKKAITLVEILPQ